jgi:hypothetical protein
MTTPVETTSTVVRSIVEWTRDYADALATIYGDDWDGPAVAQEIADTLDADQQTYVRETREDVGMTNERKEVVAGTRRLVASASSMAELAFENDPNVGDIVNDFAPVPPSRIRSPNTAQKALTRIQAALEIHGDAMRQELSHVDAFEQHVGHGHGHLGGAQHQRLGALVAGKRIGPGVLGSRLTTGEQQDEDEGQEQKAQQHGVGHWSERVQSGKLPGHPRRCNV